jgi:membrane protein
VIEQLYLQIQRSKVAQLLIRTVIKWQKDECLEMGASLAYYALFSLFPILMVILSIFGLFLGPNTSIYQQILTLAQGALPAEAFNMVKDTLINLNQSSVGAGLIGFGLLLMTASKIFEALNRSVDRIWNVIKTPETNQKFKHIALTAVKDKIFSFLLVLSSAFLILLSLLSNIAIKIIVEIVAHFKEAINWLQIDDLLLIKALQVSISLLLSTSVVMFLFKTLPSTRIYWRDIWLGSVLTVALMSLLQHLVSSGIISIGGQFRAYGVIGNVMVLMLWIYLTIQIFFLGCEFTYVYTHLFGSRARSQVK